MEEPTLEQVKEYFKNAKKVKCLIDNKESNINTDKIYKSHDCVFWCYSKSYECVSLYEKLSERYAEITEYKTPTLEQVKEHFKNAKTVKCLHDRFTYTLDIETIRETRWGYWCYACGLDKSIDVVLFSKETNKIAEITEYKEDVKDIEVIAEEVAPYYDNSNGSLYKISKQRKWNAYQFDIIKRIDRCLKKGEFERDLKKTKVLIDLFLKENNE